ncbi:MAG: type IA DNA topoisomerase, partial [Lachnospiraceae bacterium]|nr:type IA DNA topoisomerase [Lachnospiraceae bacterium]
LKGYAPLAGFSEEALAGEPIKKLLKSRYVNDKQITDHYALIPTGQGLSALGNLSDLHRKVYDLVARRFLSIFYPPAVYQKVNLDVAVAAEGTGQNHPMETFHAGFKTLIQEGYLKVSGREKNDTKETNVPLQALQGLRKGTKLPVQGYEIKTGETTPPKRYTTGQMILTMENAGQFIEDEELRAQIKGSGIGTSATRAEILDKLVRNGYLSLEKKTQVLAPSLFGELICEVVRASIGSLLNPSLTASWEKGLSQVEQGSVTEALYMEKVRDFITRRTSQIKGGPSGSELEGLFARTAGYYGKQAAARGGRS